MIDETGEQTNREIQTREQALVRSMLKDAYSSKEIMRLADVPELSLRKDEVKKALAEYDVAKEAAKEAMKALGRAAQNSVKWILKTVYTPTSVAMKYHWGPAPFIGSFFGMGAGIAITQYLNGGVKDPVTSNGGGYYLLAHLGLLVADGLHALYLHEKEKLIQERISELEKLTTESE